MHTWQDLQEKRSQLWDKRDGISAQNALVQTLEVIAALEKYMKSSDGGPVIAACDCYQACFVLICNAAEICRSVKITAQPKGKYADHPEKGCRLLAGDIEVLNKLAGPARNHGYCTFWGELLALLNELLPHLQAATLSELEASR